MARDFGHGLHRRVENRGSDHGSNQASVDNGLLQSVA
jgi:hypothetical protein